VAHDIEFGRVAARVIELALFDRHGSLNGRQRPDPVVDRKEADWLIRLVCERARYGAFPVDGRPRCETLARWLDREGVGREELQEAERQLRRWYQTYYFRRYSMPRRADGALGYLPPELSEHAHRVLNTPARRAYHHRRPVGERGGDCVVVAVATVLRVSYAEALGLLGREALTGMNRGILMERLTAAGVRYTIEYAPHDSDYNRILLRHAGKHWPTGRHLLGIKDHLAALVDGVVDDHAGGEAARLRYRIELLD
jgi:hypothetical protein